jgi:hypothetical protein
VTPEKRRRFLAALEMTEKGLGMTEKGVSFRACEAGEESPPQIDQQTNRAVDKDRSVEQKSSRSIAKLRKIFFLLKTTALLLYCSK